MKRKLKAPGPVEPKRTDDAPPSELPTERAKYHHGDLPRALRDATLAILAEHGSEAFTLREAARRVGVNHRAVYRHFEDKRALLATVAEEGYRALAVAMRETVAGSGSVEAVDRLVALSLGYVRFARGEPARYQVMFGPRLNADDRFPSLEVAIRDAVSVVAAELKRACPTSPSIVRRDAGVTLWSAVHGFASLLLVSRVPLKDKHVTRYVDAVMRPVASGVVASLVSHSPSP